MDLTDEKVLETLLHDWEQRAVERERKPPRVFRRCVCGLCKMCFQAKFADPDYYQRRSLVHSSPLADC